MPDQIQDDSGAPSEFHVKPLLYRAFAMFWEQKGLLISTQLLLLAILSLGNYMLNWVGGYMLLGPFILGAYKINLAIVRNKDTDIFDFLAGFEYFLPAFVANILIHFSSFVGMGLLLIPGLLILLTYAPTYLYILEHNHGFWDALESSRKMTWGNKKSWLTLGAAIAAINVAGFLCLIVGLVVTLTYTRLLITLAYEEEQARIARQEREEETVRPLVHGAEGENVDAAPT